MRRVKMPAVGQILDVAHSGIALQLVDGVQPFTAIDGFNLRINSSNTSRKSPTSGTSTLTFLLISAGSISM